jgi:hypothetical protein
LSVELKAFTDNDQGASGDVVPYLHKDDLLIRDLGYFSLYTFGKIIDQKAFFISRLRYGVHLFNEKGEKVSWKALLNKKGIMDKIVWMGEKQRIKVRLILVPLPAAVAAERVRKGRADRDKRLNHSLEYYQWLSYSVFVSNVEQETLSGRDIAAAYRVRWQIELIFKSWKSTYGLQQMLHQGCTNEHRVRACIYMLLMLCCIVVQKVYVAYYEYIKKRYGKDLSLMKLTAFALHNLMFVITGPLCEIKRQLAAHCCYESRNKRVNMTEFLHYL